MAAVRRARRTRSAIRAQPAASVFGNSMANSSAPYLAARSEGRRASAARIPATIRKHLIAGGMTVFVVIFLEMVEVDDQKPERAALAIGPAPLLLHALVETAAISDTRETVFGRQRLEPFRQILPFRDVACDGDGTVDFADVLSSNPQGGLDPDIALFAMPGAVRGTRFLDLAPLQPFHNLARGRQVERIDPRQGRTFRQADPDASPRYAPTKARHS
jgi:hypothetical protein